ncbi:MAG: hypothetical protein P8J87_01100, partial [Verrucomicrobiales bacterium]|nr:hypothetical protein [Verrucomicrobiales bacterium]
NTTPTDGGLADGGGAYLFDRVATTGNPLASLKAVAGSYGLQKRNDDGSGLGGPVATTPVSTSEFQITAVRRNRTADQFEIWVDGNLEGTSADTGANLTPQPIVIGRHATITTGGFDGDIAELLIYGSGLSDNDFQAVGTYLENEYGLDTAFAGSSIKTQLSENASTAYLRSTFTFTGAPSHTTLQLQASVADGAALYLNGTEIHRANLPEGPLDHATIALTNPPEPLHTGIVAVPAGALVNGQNTLAVRLHRSSPASETFFSAGLAATETPPGPDAAATLVINEISSAFAGDDAFYIELKNISNTPVTTTGYSIALSSGENFDLPPGAFQAGDSVAFDAADLGFRPSSGDRVFLYAPGNTVADARRVTNRLRGRSPDHLGRWLFPSAESPGTTNPFTFNSDIVINEIHYNPAPLQASPPSLQTDPLFTFSHNWRFNESGENLGATWAADTHPVAGNWKTGPGVHAFESGLPVTVGTNLSFPNFNTPYVTTYYFETEFALTETQAASAEALSLTHLIDDGAVFYLNGTE